MWKEWNIFVVAYFLSDTLKVIEYKKKTTSVEGFWVDFIQRLLCFLIDEFVIETTFKQKSNLCGNFKNLCLFLLIDEQVKLERKKIIQIN